MSEEQERQKYGEITLAGMEGKGFEIITMCKYYMKKAGASGPEIDAFVKEATSGDYDKLLHTVQDWFEVVG
jgi:hypothetical protein